MTRLDLDVPPLVAAVVDACADAGGRTLLVGGGVRDHLMGGDVKDWDLEVYGLDPDDLERALATVGRVDTVGRAFAVFKIHKRGVELDVSIPRRDSKAGPGHRGILAEGDPTMTPDEAALRRDLTINALMVDLQTRELLDPTGGQADVLARRLAPVDEGTFLEDPLRALRAVQFAARFDFEPTPALERLCAQAALEELPEERLLGEWAKLLLRGIKPSRGVDLARRTGQLARLFPDHPHDPAVDAALDRAVALRDATYPDDTGRLDPEGRRFAFMVAVWLAFAPEAAWAPTLDRLKLFRWMGFATRDVALAAVAHHADAHTTDADLRWLSTRAEADTALAVHAAVADVDTMPARHRLEALGLAHEAPPRLVQGRDLIQAGVKPGPAMGRVLDAVYAQQLDGAVTTPAEALAAALGIVGG